MAGTETKLPRAVRKGPLITLTCECGRRKEVHYGELWTCEGCGRRFDTNKIPLEDYTAIRRTQVRYRLVPLGLGVVMLAAIIAFVATGRAIGAVIVVPFLVASFNMFVRPFFRSRYRRRLTENAPSWNVKAD